MSLPDIIDFTRLHAYSGLKIAFAILRREKSVILKEQFTLVRLNGLI